MFFVATENLNFLTQKKMLYGLVRSTIGRDGVVFLCQEMRTEHLAIMLLNYPSHFFLSSVNAFPFLHIWEHLLPMCNKTRLSNSLLDLVAKAC